MEHKKDDIPHQLQELSDYIDSLFEEHEIVHKREFQHMIVLTVFLAIHIAAIFLFEYVSLVTGILFWSVFWYGIFFIQGQSRELHGKIDGCFTTLEILGMMDKGSWTKRKKYKFSDLFTPLVKHWAELKEKMRREPYGQPIPALAVK